MTAATKPKRITFKQRRFWMPWIVEWITQEWSDYLRCWIVVSRVRVWDEAGAIFAKRKESRGH